MLLSLAYWSIRMLWTMVFRICRACGPPSSLLSKSDRLMFCPFTVAILPPEEAFAEHPARIVRPKIALERA